MKYKAYLTKSNKIFWTKNSVDKPTKDYFNQLMNSIEWLDLGNLTPNFINQFNGSLVVDRNDYTYLKLINNETNEVRYYSIDRVSKELNNGYVIDITLDVFATYTINFYDTLNETPIKVNRSTAYCLASDNYSRLQKDVLITLPQIPKLHKSNQLNRDLSFSYKEYSHHTKKLISCYRYKMSSDSEWILKERYPYETYNPFIAELSRFDRGYLYDQMLFDVYQDVDGSWFLVPIFGERDNYNNSVDWWAEFSVTIIRDINYKCFNYLEFVEKVKNNTFWVNKYKGRFHIPNWINLFTRNGLPVIINTNTDDNNRSYSILMVKIRNGINSLDDGRATPYNINFDFTSSLDTFSKYSNKKINSYAFSKISQDETPIFYFGETLKEGKYYLTGQNTKLFINLKDKGINYSFNPTTGISWFTFGYNCVVKLDGTETFPTSTNEYKSYLASVQSTQNTQIQVAKQNAIWGGVKQAIGGVMGVASSLASGNVAGAVSSGMGAITGIADSVMQYQNKKREMDAQNADKQRSSIAKNFEPSSVESVIKNSTIRRYSIPNTNRINFGELDGVISSTSFSNIYSEMDCSLINKIVWECGYIVNKTITMSNINQSFQLSFFDDRVNKFIYWDMEIPEELIKITYPNYNNELIEAISTTINNPVRFWKDTPNYNESLHIAYRKSSRSRN